MVNRTIQILKFMLIPIQSECSSHLDFMVKELPLSDTFAKLRRCFLLIQAYLQKARLPISDYINDTKTAMDNVPRLLAAMQFIAARELRVEGIFEVVCQLYRTKQLISTKSTVRQQHSVSISPICPPMLTYPLSASKGSDSPASWCQTRGSWSIN
jgi:hypothetical protein